MIKGLFFILWFYYAGELTSSLMGGFIPGSVMGMLLLFAALSLKILPATMVRDTATVLTKNMAIFFVPAAVGLMAYGAQLRQYWLLIAVGIGLSTILTIASVALTQQFLENRTRNHESDA